MKNIQVAKEASAKAIKELEEAKSVLEVIEGQSVPSERPGRLRRLQGFADKAKEEEVTTEESLEAKEALLARGLEEGKVCYSLIFVYLIFVSPLHVCGYAYFAILSVSNGTCSAVQS
jgi:nuclear cap-binding protein subunit 1